MGVEATSLATIIGSIRHMPKEVRLVQADDVGLLKELRSVAYTGPLLKAPSGIYHLWQGQANEPLLINDRQILLGRQLLHVKEKADAPWRYLPGHVHMTLRDLLSTTGKVVVVYANDTGDQTYQITWPHEKVPLTHPTMTGYHLVGLANLETGEIR